MNLDNIATRLAIVASSGILVVYGAGIATGLLFAWVI